MNKEKCVSGCLSLTGGDIKHHIDCPYYEESLTKMYNELKTKNKALKDRASNTQDIIIEYMVKYGYYEDSVGSSSFAANLEKAISKRIRGERSSR